MVSHQPYMYSRSVPVQLQFTLNATRNLKAGPFTSIAANLTRNHVVTSRAYHGQETSGRGSHRSSLYVSTVWLQLSQLTSRTDIQPKKYRPSAFWKLASNENDKPAYADPVASSKTCGELQPIRSLDPKVPTIRTTLSCEDVSKQSRVPIIPYVPITSKDHTVPKPIIRPNRRGQQDRELAIEPRKFHLAKGSLPLSSPYLVSKTPAQKHRKSRKRELAVFVEKTGEMRKAKPTRRDHALNDGSIAECFYGEERDIVRAEINRKGPNATPTEREWRAQNWYKSGIPARSTELGTRTGNNVNDPSHQWDYESPELAEQLQQIAFQETRAAEKRSNQIASLPHLRTQPMPPKPRRPAVQRNAHQSDEVDVLALDDDDNDYVFDTYVRSHVHPVEMSDSAKPHAVPMQDIDPLNMGILVIEGGEIEELWETFGEDLDSDPDFNSEEEDENGMSPLPD